MWAPRLKKKWLIRESSFASSDSKQLTENTHELTAEILSEKKYSQVGILAEKDLSCFTEHDPKHFRV